ncbi:MAG: Rap1a/Tai family immunity protein [Desulfuromonadales bacterium]|nr:Rap1a/Tai family immunity protein [Desulfuromonadales bacterium]
MKQAILALLIVLLSHHALPAEELTFDGHVLLDNCQQATSKEATDFVRVGFCFGQIRGINDMNILFKEFIPETYAGYCIPGGITLGQQARIVLNYLNKHQDDLDKDSSVLVLAAQLEAFPCEQESP